jgi:hypothetical protein
LSLFDSLEFWSTVDWTNDSARLFASEGDGTFVEFAAAAVEGWSVATDRSVECSLHPTNQVRTSALNKQGRVKAGYMMGPL